MEPLVEVRPNACLFVLGPQLTRCTSTRLRYKSVVKSALDYLQECAVHHDSPIGDMIGSEPLRAMEVATTLLKSNGLYDKWLERTFTGFEPEYTDIPDSVQWLIELQRMGAMLACTQYDALLDKMAGRRPAVISSRDHSFSDWLSCGLHHRKKARSQDATAKSSSEREKGVVVVVERHAASSKHTQRVSGFLHLHGASTSIDSIHLHPYAEIKAVRKGGCAEKPFSFIPDEILAGLRGVFHSKLVFLVGFDEGHRDPLLLSFLQLIYPEGDAKVLKNPPILLTSFSPDAMFLQCEPAKILQLRIASADRLRDAILPGEPKNFSVGTWK